MARVAGWLLALLVQAGLSGSAFAGTTSLYPLEGQDIDPRELVAIQATIGAAMQSHARTGGMLEPATPFLIKRTCGEHPDVRCLTGLARGGFVLSSSAKQTGQFALVELTLTDSAGKTVAKTRFKVELLFLDDAPALRAMAALERMVQDSVRAAKAAEVPKAPVPPVSSAPAAIPLKAATSPELTAVSSTPGAWKRTGGPLLTAAGALLLATGAVVGFLDWQLANSLDDKARNHTLSPADADSYSRVRAYNVAANALFAGGGILAGIGVYCWVSAPSSGGPTPGVQVALSGTF